MKIEKYTSSKILTSLLGMFCLVALCACSDEEEWYDATSNREPIIFSASYPLQSRATETGFEDKDRMGVFVVDYEQSQPGELLLKGNRANNVQTTFDEPSLRWKTSVELYWKDKNTPIDVYGYYPFDDNLQSVSEQPFCVETDQRLRADDTSMSAYEKSDFLWAKATRITPTEKVIPLMFKHLMAGVNITLQPRKGFAEGEWEQLSKEVLITNTIVDATINLEKGTVSTEGTRSKIILPYKYQQAYRAVVVPQVIPAATEVINITIDGKSYAHKLPQEMTLQPSRMHQFTIVVDKRADTGDFAFTVETRINPWIDDSEFHDGIIREYVIADVAKDTSLEDVLKQMHKDVAQIRNLKLKGYVDEADFQYIHDNMPILMNINLKEVIVVDQQGEPTYIIPDNAFVNCKLLNKVFFPDKLLEIGSSAFQGTALNGSIIFPEGLKTIRDVAFEGCTSLTGDLVLPNSVEKVGGLAFSNTGYTGKLVLPERLTYVGDRAFFLTLFSGPLRLPENLKYIGESAFSFCNFDGDLIIPQGIKEIKERTFHTSGKGFTGTLELPEGLEKISERAFIGCHFKGELVLPKTLTFIGLKCFMENDFSRIVFPESLNFIGQEAFAACTRLTGTIRLPQKMTTFNVAVFKGCKSIERIEIPEYITTIGREAFSECTGINSIVCESEVPPVLASNSFELVSRKNFTIEVPAKAVETYQHAKGWKEFKRISAYSNFVCRPQNVCSINSAHKQNLILNADGDWKVTHLPDWCSVTPMSGSHKTELKLTVNNLPHGSSTRKDSIVFSLNGSEHVTCCDVMQYDCEYDEDECVQLQQATRGKGINIVFVGDGYDARLLSDGTYLKTVKKEMEYFFGIEPYRSFRDCFNVYACFSLSQETGINTVHTYRDTRFNTMYGGCKVKIAIDAPLIMDYIKHNTPITSEQFSHSLVVVIPNSPDYVGNTVTMFNGTPFAICPPLNHNDDLRVMVQREAGGLGFGKLGDERVLSNAFITTDKEADIIDAHNMGWWLNLSLSGKMKGVYWKDLIFDSRFSDRVDIFEGGYGYTRGVFRSELESCMNVGIPYYNTISRYLIMKRIHEYAGIHFDKDVFLANDTFEWGPLAEAYPHIE